MASLTNFLNVTLSGFLFAYFLLSLTDNPMASSEDDFQSKSGRLINFNTDDGNVKLDLSFTSTFIEIPVKQSLDLTRTAVAKINVGALILTGIVFVVSAVILPSLIPFFAKKFLLPSNDDWSSDDCRSSARDLNTDSNLWRYLSVVDNTLQQNDIDVSSCMQRMLCSTVKKASYHMENGQMSGMDKIIDGIASSDWLLSLIYDTPVYSAMKNGLSNVTCFEEYHNCKISQRTVNVLLKKSGKLLHSLMNN